MEAERGSPASGLGFQRLALSRGEVGSLLELPQILHSHLLHTAVLGFRPFLDSSSWQEWGRAVINSELGRGSPHASCRPSANPAALAPCCTSELEVLSPASPQSFWDQPAGPACQTQASLLHFRFRGSAEELPTLFPLIFHEPAKVSCLQAAPVPLSCAFTGHSFFDVTFRVCIHSLWLLHQATTN